MSAGVGGRIDGGGALDMSALVELLSDGGAAKKITEYQKAKAELEKAKLDLNVGMDVKRALEEAQKTLADAQKQKAEYKLAVEKELEAKRKAHQDWLDSTKKEVQAKLDSAADTHARADALIADQSALWRVADAAKAEAQSILAKAKLEAAGITNKANDLAKKAESALKDYQALKSKYDAALSKIKSAIAEI